MAAKAGSNHHYTCTNLRLRQGDNTEFFYLYVLTAGTQHTQGRNLSPEEQHVEDDSMNSMLKMMTV